MNFTSDSWRNISSKDADQFHNLFDSMVIETHCASAVARQIDLSFKSMLNESCSSTSFVVLMYEGLNILPSIFSAYG